MSKAKDTFETRVSRLGNYLTRAYKYNKPSILFAMYMSEFLREEVGKSLEEFLKEEGLKVVNVDAGKNKDVPSFISSMNSDNNVFLVYNMKHGFPEALQFLNFKREELIEHHAKVIFWVKEDELVRISAEAPDFFAFRNRVIELMEVPRIGVYKPVLIKSISHIEYKLLDEIKRDIELKEKLLSELSGKDELSGYLLGSLGLLYTRIGLYNKAIKYTKKALKIAKKTGHKITEVLNLNGLGVEYSRIGSTREAIEYLEKAIEIAQEIGFQNGEQLALGNLGNVYRDIGSVRKAIEYLEKALKIAQEIEDKQNIAGWLGNLGLAYSYLDQTKNAIEYYEKALKIAQELDDKTLEGTWLGNLGIAYSKLGEIRKAIELYEKALKIDQTIGDKYGGEIWFLNIGDAYRDLGEIGKAIEYYQKALKIAQEIGDQPSKGSSLLNLGHAFFEAKKYKEALAFLLLSKDAFTRIESPDIKRSKSVLEKLKNELGEKDFEKLIAEIAPKAEEIVQQILEKDSI